MEEQSIDEQSIQINDDQINEEIEQPEDYLQIPEILKAGEYKPKIVDEENAIIEQNVKKD